MAVLPGYDSYTWTNGEGNTLDLTDMTKWRVMPADGFGVPDLDLTIRETPYGDGGQWIFTKVKPRKFKMYIWSLAPDWATQQGRRDALIQAFSPKFGKGTLQIVRASGNTRAIDCTISAGLKFLANGRHGMNRLEEIEFTADDPFFYDPTTDGAQSTVYGGASGTHLNQVLTFTLGASNTPLILTLTNGGDAESYPIFTVPGPATNPTFVNYTTGKAISYAGFIAGGSTLTFDHTFNNPQVSISGVSVWNGLTIWSSFWSITAGTNTVAYFQNETGITNTITYQYKQRYSGI